MPEAAEASKPHRSRGANYVLGLHRELIERLENGIQELETVKEFSVTRPYTRTLPDGLAGKVGATLTNARSALESLEESLREVEEAYGG
jgi:uncharacterized protein (DUF4213/DUF364 family)